MRPAECWACGRVLPCRYDKFCGPGCEAAFDQPEAVPFELRQPSPERKPIPPVAVNVGTHQKPLFLGAKDLRGQSYLFH